MKSKMVFDIGMNNGDDTAYYLHQGFNVVAVEANPQLTEKAAVRFREQIVAGRLIILNVGIVAEEKDMSFWVCESNSEWSSFHRAIASRDNCPHHEIRVPGRRLDSILEEFGVPYYLKVDIEGNDRLCLEALRGRPLPEYTSVEASDLALLDFLAELGYTKFKCISQFDYLPLQIPASVEEQNFEFVQRLLNNRNTIFRLIKRFGGRYMLQKYLDRRRREGDWKFLFGSSGPFGEKLPGKWLKHDDLRIIYTAFQQMMQSGHSSLFWGDKDYSFWTDFHATR